LKNYLAKSKLEPKLETHNETEDSK
jgi:hypothetical protein